MTTYTRNCQDRRAPSMKVGMGGAGTQVWETARSHVWHTGCQTASTCDGAQHTPQKTWRQAPGLFAPELVPLKGAWQMWLVRLVRLVGQPPLDKAGEPSQRCSLPWVWHLGPQTQGLTGALHRAFLPGAVAWALGRPGLANSREETRTCRWKGFPSMDLAP